MTRFLHAFLRGLSSRALPPLVMGFFLLIYIGIAFATDETLVALIEVSRRSVILVILLALLPLNHLARLVKESACQLKRSRALRGSVPADPALFDEAVPLSAPVSLTGLEERLAAQGYRTRTTEGTLAAWRGVGNFPARLFWRAAIFCLFAGIMISLGGRDSSRGAIIEGVQLPETSGGGRVERVVLAPSQGAILSRSLTMEVAPPGGGEGKRVFGLYPPALYRGVFIYPRYLGIGLKFRLTAPDLPGGFENLSVLNIHPAGKEDSVEVPGTPYRLIFSLAPAEDGSDPYMTGRLAFMFKLFKGKELLFSGSAPAGAEFARDGYLLSFPDARRLVITDFIRDYGVLLIWTAALLLVATTCLWLPVRLFFPRREMLFVLSGAAPQAHYRAEGGRRRHAGVFHEVLDLLETKRQP